MNFQNPDDTIVAVSTPAGAGAIALIRISGKKSIEITSSIFSKKLNTAKSHTVHFGQVKDGDAVIDEVVVSVFLNPKSFTGEDIIEIGCHGSAYIQREILRLIVSKGARLAAPGEFSLRAFMHGKMDLSQTEAIADLISSNSKAAHKIAMHQMRGGFGNEINSLREQLLNFASLVELELDFSQEDVEFADRSALEKLITAIYLKVDKLIDSFRLGNVLKNGVPVAIVGAPNAGKSTLLNALLNEERAIVSEIAGTTRDVIEDTIIIDGIEFRFIDTAGIRETSDRIEIMGIERSYEQIRKATVILLLFDLKGEKVNHILDQIELFRAQSIAADQHLIPVFNKKDEINESDFNALNSKGIFISAREKGNLDQLKSELLKAVSSLNTENDQLIVTNERHFEVLKKCKSSLDKIKEGMSQQIPGDLLAMDIREAIYHLGEITGTITNDELLGNIFGKFCIGK
ncbi:MAG: tRNA uridine-5-carboxymethylaminomethyl(34) synthesis GTPase MnmE [Crocinitomicaceae bacterium]|nr:tRNA uridine-5-carboxymethylaminomethyl(34) synthesis GTPase MnmE [Crocinitomicaceae bacterium]